MIFTKARLLILSVLLTLSASSFGQNVRGFYLQNVGSWLGDATEENEILQYAQGNGFNYILFYDLGDINWSSTTEKNQLAAFMVKARNQYGITQIGGVVEYAGYVSQKLLPYNNSRTSQAEKFDVINLEFEFWVSSSISNSYCSKFLNAAGYSCDSAGAFAFAWKEFKLIDDICANNGMISEFYLGWPNKGQMQKIASRADRILLSAYRPTDSDIYVFSKNRLADIGTIGGTTKVITLMSSESSFMGPWLQTHPQTRPYQTMASALAAETASFRNNIQLEGYTWFTYKYMPKTMLATASITASGPLTFCPGGSVTLTANSGSQYLWSPGGQTTRSITVSNAGSYTVRVTNSSGTNATSSPAVVSNAGTGTMPVVTASGPTSFCPGGSVTLSCNTAPSYSWSNGQTTQSITVSTSGSYTVTTGGGTCSGTSTPITVNANAAPAVPTVTASGSLNVCPGTVLTLTSSQSSGYLWSNGATTRSIAITTPGTYSVRAYSGPNCSALSSDKVVTFLSAPSKPVISPNSSTTLSSTHTSVTLTASSASAYSWSNGSSSRSITVTSQGNYRVTVTGTNGCKATSSDIIVKANGCIPPPAPTITASGSTIISSGQTVTLTSSVSGGYLWSNGATTRSITVSSAGSYTVRAYNGGGCFSTSLPSAVTLLQVRQAITENENIEESVNFSSFPNPAQDDLNLTFNSSNENSYSVRLLDLTGKVVQERTFTAVIGENKVHFDVSTLSGGVYFGWLLSDNLKQTIKIIVNRGN